MTHFLIANVSTIDLPHPASFCFLVVSCVGKSHTFAQQRLSVWGLYYHRKTVTVMTSHVPEAYVLDL